MLKEMRRKELRERYKFECRCEECERVGGDPREAFECLGQGCDGLLPFIGKAFNFGSAQIMSKLTRCTPYSGRRRIDLLEVSNYN